MGMTAEAAFQRDLADAQIASAEQAGGSLDSGPAQIATDRNAEEAAEFARDMDFVATGGSRDLGESDRS